MACNKWVLTAHEAREIVEKVINRKPDAPTKRRVYREDESEIFAHIYNACLEGDTECVVSKYAVDDEEEKEIKDRFDKAAVVLNELGYCSDVQIDSKNNYDLIPKTCDCVWIAIDWSGKTKADEAWERLGKKKSGKSEVVVEKCGAENGNTGKMESKKVESGSSLEDCMTQITILMKNIRDLQEQVGILQDYVYDSGYKTGTKE